MISRYSNVPVIRGKFRGTARYTTVIYHAVVAGVLPVREITMSAGGRLDVIAGKMYGSGTYWWIIAAASGIGWATQVPPGTIIKAPTSLERVFRLLGI